MKFFLIIILLIVALLGFIYFGGADYLRIIGRETDRAAEHVEKYEKKMHSVKKRAEEIKEKAKEAGRKIEKFINE